MHVGNQAIQSKVWGFGVLQCNCKVPNVGDKIHVGVKKALTNCRIVAPWNRRFVNLNANINDVTR